MRRAMSTSRRAPVVLAAGLTLLACGGGVRPPGAGAAPGAGSNDGSGPAKDTSKSGMAVNVSKDGGRTWSKAVVLEQDGLEGLNDKNWLVADNGTGVGHTAGRVYVVWDRIAPLVYSYCDK